ncbi:adenylate/guanylate cyclase domain-containing protein [Chitinivibrio alkaliphilus]|uniref:Adenylate/guanylate cyclase with Chase sensor n=1 Tax=Chitinivibrio alkaliphilus ACht1 TaxID=1313304 RepID=U7D867_9BACT|nr:adenylate/guanylate cyclase domain-containing protein [Chitinivibrio alkaliphilus]ERP39150.1 adenylate/guanylate cyclase with Chase sensor [Chitinivibrio alkaliphilus ACht1]
MTKKGMPKEHRPQSQKYKLLWGGLVFSFAFVALLFRIPTVAVQEWRVYDFWTRNEHGGDVSSSVAVVGIDEDFFETLGFTWPLRKDVYARILMMLEEYGATVTALDIIFIDEMIHDDDALFLQYLAASPSVIPGFGFVVRQSDGGRGVIPGQQHRFMERFSHGDGEIYFDDRSVRRVQRPYDAVGDVVQRMGFINRAVPMPDGVDRKMPVLLSANSRVYASLALEAVLAYTDHTLSYDLDKSKLHLSDDTISLDAEYGITVNFSDSLPFYSLSSLYRGYNAYLRGDTDSLPQLLDKAIVFVGSAAETVGDLGLTPLSQRYSSGRSPIVQLHAQTAHTLLEGDPVVDLGFRAASILSFGALLLLYGIFLFLSKKFLFICIPLLFISLYMGAYFLYLENVFLPMVQAFVSVAIFTGIGIIVDYLEDNREYKYLTSLFKTYLSPQYIEEMARTHTIPKLGGESVYGTAFFTDIEKFSTFSEKFDNPQDLVAVLNTYFSKMTNILLENKGTLDRYSGDAIIAFFGAPQRIPQNAFHACKAACQMQRALRELEVLWQKDPDISQKITSMRTRIGINTGNFVTGNIGCDIRMNYTMIGDSVNLAARLESAAKQYGVSVLVGETTREDAGDSFFFRWVDTITVVGKKQPVRVYELMGEKEVCETEEQTQINDLINVYESALQKYTEGDFSTALEEFRRSCEREISPGMSPSTVMVKRTEYLCVHPPSQWNGVFSLTQK